MRPKPKKKVEKHSFRPDIKESAKSMTRIERPPTCDYKVQESIDDAITRIREGKDQNERKKKMHT